MPKIPPAIPEQTRPATDPAAPLTANHEGSPRSPVRPDSMHRAEDDADARAVSRDFGEQAPKPSRE